MEIFKLFGSVLIDDKDANKSLDDIDKKADGVGGKLGSMIGTAAKWGAGVVAGAAVAGAGLFALATKASDTASEINDMSVRTGFSTDRLQELKFAADQSGVSFDSIQSAVAKLTMNMGKATVEGKGMSLAFEQLGVKTKDSNGHLLDSQTVFDQTLLKLSGMKNETERNALGMKIFGKGFTELSPLVAGGADSLKQMSDQAHKLGLVMSADAVSAGDTFGDTLDAMKSTLGGVVTKIGVELMPIFQKMMDWVLVHMPEIQAGIHTAFTAVGTVINTTVDVVKSLTQFFTENWSILQPILAGIAAGALVFGIYSLAINASAIATGIWTTVTGVATAVGTAFGAVLAFITSPIGLIVIAIGLLVAAGVLLYKHWDEVSAFLKKTWDTIKQTATTVFKAIGDFVSSVWEGIKTTAQTVWNGIKAFFSTVWEGIKFIFFNLTLAGILIKHWDEIKATINEVWNGIKTFISGVWNGISSTASTVFNGIKNTLSGVWTSVKGTISTVWNGIETTITGVWDRIVGGVKGSINSIIGAINGMIRGLNKIHVDVPAWVTKATGMSNFGLNISTIPLLAEGGDITRAGRVMVGEQGPEFLDLPEGARVTPLDKAGGYQTANITVLLDGKTLAKALGKPLVDHIRVSTGLR